jgi:uncharacterized protein (DUF924 family)
VEKDAAFDTEITSRFMPTWEAASRGQLASWETTDDGALALIIVLDQFPRNMFRNDPRTYATDDLALKAAERALSKGVDKRVANELQQFVYMPFMHSEELKHQERCVELFKAAGNTFNLGFAEDHADIVRRFGRFPHRNKILGRETTADEQAFLDSGGFSG